ncbi:MAG: hypothetical protein M1838_005692 [Thelocarpon superellum]|nr:MAG: hypothetical protein M1838_005692 [Thelocarpon superellum]
MATEQAPMPVNGTYNASGSQYAGAAETHLSSQQLGHASGTSVPAPDSFGSQNAHVPAAAGQASADNSKHTEIPKDQVGWHFVEQYYLNLSRSPNKLHLFYNKQSQFVWGVEAEKVAVCVGRTAISERIRELDFQDCKVRVLNVDSQASFKNILIQVIGEMSNKSAPHRKFVQTFVLAEQPNGYFVLNDVFRYINDEDEYETEVNGFQEETPAQVADHERPEPTRTEPRALTSSADLAQQRLHAAVVDEQLEPKVLKTDVLSNGHVEPTPASSGNGLHVTPKGDFSHVEDAETVSHVLPSGAPASEAVTETAQEEKPKEPTSTPVAEPTAQPVAPTVAPPKPAAPKTWANLVAASRSPGPVAPSSTSSTPPALLQAKAAPPAAASSQPQASAESGSTHSPSGNNSGWQTPSNDHAKRQVRGQFVAGEKDNVLAYVKPVTEKVTSEALRVTLQKYGDLAYFDVSRQKNCAFVEFATATGYNAAVAANPHHIEGEQIYVEERRPRSGAYGGVGYNAGRGGSGRGRGGGDIRPGSQGRGGFQKDGGRGGGFNPGRGRGGNFASRGRGGNPGT